MAIVPKKHDFDGGDPILAALVNENFDDIFNLSNGLLDKDNLDDNAEIKNSQLATISDGNTVLGSALNTLTGIPASAGLIPSTSQDLITAIVFADPLPTVATAGTIFTIDVTADFVLQNPSAGAAGMKRVWRFTQDATGGHKVTSLDTEFRVASNILTGGTFQIDRTPNAITYIGAIYDGTNWDIIALSRGVA